MTRMITECPGVTVPPKIISEDPCAYWNMASRASEKMNLANPLVLKFLLLVTSLAAMQTAITTLYLHLLYSGIRLGIMILSQGRALRCCSGGHTTHLEPWVILYSTHWPGCHIALTLAINIAI